jgi:hypothetical protein
VARFGDDSAGASSFPCSSDRALLSLFTLTEAADVTEIVCIFEATTTAGCSFKGLIYADAGGTPGARIAVGAATAIPAGASTTASACVVTLAAGDYWLGLVTDGFEARMQCDASGGLSRMEAATYASPAGTWTQSGTGSARLNVYAEYTAVPSGPPQPTLYFRKFPELAPEAGDAAWVGSDPASVILRNEFFGLVEEPSGGTLAVTEAADTAALSGTVRASGPLAATEGADAAAITGTVRSIATLASTEASDTASSAGSVIAGGTLAGLEAADAFTADGDVTTPSGGSLAATEASDTAALAGTIVASGPLATAETGDSASGSGSVLAVGSLATSEAPDTALLSGSARNTGDLVATEPGGDSAAVAGSILIAGVLAASELADIFAATQAGSKGRVLRITATGITTASVTARRVAGAAVDARGASTTVAANAAPTTLRERAATAEVSDT